MDRNKFESELKKFVDSLEGKKEYGNVRYNKKFFGKNGGYNLAFESFCDSSSQINIKFENEKVYLQEHSHGYNPEFAFEKRIKRLINAIPSYRIQRFLEEYQKGKVPENWEDFYSSEEIATLNGLIKNDNQTRKTIYQRRDSKGTPPLG